MHLRKAQLILFMGLSAFDRTYKQVELFKKYLPGGVNSVSSVLLIGGGNTKEQIRVLQSGADIVVGTPGRIGDFLSTGKLNVSQVKFYILDEADGLLTGGATGMKTSCKC